MTIPPNQPEPVLTVSPERLRNEFNARGFYQRMRSGELRRRVHNPTIHLKGRLARARHEPRCTHSQIVSYYDLDGVKVAVVHQYRRRDGSLGASGLPDPKWLRIDNEIWIVNQ